MPLQFRRGTAAQRIAATDIPDPGEPWFTTDDGKLYVGNGSTPGGVEIGANLSLGDLNDVQLIDETNNLIVSYSVTSNVAEIVLSNPHGFFVGLQIVISGSSVTALNGTKTITQVTGTNSVRFALTASNIGTTSTNGNVIAKIPDTAVVQWNEAEGYFETVNKFRLDNLDDVNLTSLANGQSIAYNSTTQKWVNTTLATDVASLTDVTLTSLTDGDVLMYDSATSSWQNSVISVSGLGARTTASATTASIADGASANIQITGFKSYMLMSIETSAGCWVTVYTSAAARTADASRLSYVDPLPGSGVIAEVFTTTAATQKITPSLLGYNDDATPANTIYLKVENQSGATAAITVTLKLLQLEA